MKLLIRFFFNLFLAIFIKRKRFIRLSPNIKGNLFFFDKKEKNFLNFIIRDLIDSHTADQIFTYEEYDLKFLKRYYEIYSLYQNTIKKNQTPLIIDGGANIGFSTSYFSKEFYESEIVAIEPEINNFSILKKNCSKLNNIILLNKALGSNNGFVEIENVKADNNAFRTRRINRKSNSIEMVNIDSILNDYPKFFPFIIKLDIEGFEDDLFSKM